MVPLIAVLAYAHQFLLALAFSITVEGLIILVLCLLFKKDKRIAWIAVLGTVCTIPYVWFVCPTIFWYSLTTSIAVGEGGAFIFEAILYKVLGKLNWRYALIFSLLANASSYVLGRIVLS